MALIELFATVLLLATAAHSDAPHRLSTQLQGDTDAVRMARAMVQRLGDRSAWASATALHIFEEVHHPSRVPTSVSETWRMLREPRIWGQSRSAAGTRGFAYTETHAWSAAGADVTHLDAEGVARWRTRWPRNVYVMYGRLAREDPELVLKSDGVSRFVVLDRRTNERLCAFEVTAAGDVLRWLAFGDEPEEWIYGPMKDFGSIRFPDWGVRLQDNYRFYYRIVELHATRPSIMFTPPVAQ